GPQSPRALGGGRAQPGGWVDCCRPALRAVSSAGLERLAYTEEVGSSILSPPTNVLGLAGRRQVLELKGGAPWRPEWFRAPCFRRADPSQAFVTLFPSRWRPLFERLFFISEECISVANRSPGALLRRGAHRKRHPASQERERGHGLHVPRPALDRRRVLRGEGLPASRGKVFPQRRNVSRGPHGGPE